MKNLFYFLVTSLTKVGINKVFLFLGTRTSAAIKISLTIFPLHVSFISTLSTQPVIQWQKTLGGDYLETAYSSQQTSDGGYIIAGSAFSINNGDVLGVHGGGDFWIVKLDSMRTIEWQKPLGGSSTEVPYSIKQTSDGGYIVAGITHSNDGDVTNYHGDQDCWIVKINHLGEIDWQRALGGSSEDIAQSIVQTSDGGYIMAGGSSSTDGNVQSLGHGLYDAWLVKLNAGGEIQWEKLYGGSNAEIAYGIHQTSNGGFVFAGVTSSNDGDVSGNNGNEDFWVVKLDTVGVIEWQKPLGGIGSDGARDIHSISSGGFIVSGGAGSGNTGQVSGSHGLSDFWVVKLSESGVLQWQKSLGGSANDFARSIMQTSDGGYIVAGSTQSTNGDVQGNLDLGLAAWVVKLSYTGDIHWQKALGGTESERLFAVQQTADGGYMLAGDTKSNDGDVSGNHGSSDFWIIKLSPESSLTTSPQTLPLEIFPNPAQQSIALKISTEEPIMIVTISDLLGRELSLQTISNNGELNIAALPNGLYLVKATTPSGKVFSGKIRKHE